MLDHAHRAQPLQGQEEHPQVGTGAPVSTPCPTPSLPSHANFLPFRSICLKNNRSLSLLKAPEQGEVAPAEHCTEGSQFMNWVTCPAQAMLHLLSFEEFLAAQLRFFAAEAQSKGDQTASTYGPRKPSASKPGCGANCIPGTGNQRQQLINNTVLRSGVPLLGKKQATKGNSKNLITLKPRYASPGCRAPCPAAHSVQCSVVPAPVPMARSVRDGEL